ncbi:MAG: DnaJ domain-containing protein [Actinobacteria bacterium]|nr:DnaJ domain-containing protein [Actinomycetota bacterium]
MTTHYDVLGVGRSATATELRDAYRRAARAAHPDRTGEASTDRMSAVNEAWRILGDRELRRRYDAGLDAAARPTGSARPASSAAGRSEPAARPAPVVVHTPARFPWRFMAGLLSIGVALVVAGVIVYDPPPAPAPDGILRMGDCVALSAELEASEVACGGHDAVVDRLVPFDQPCPAGTQPYRDRQGMGTACVVPVGT